MKFAFLALSDARQDTTRMNPLASLVTGWGLMVLHIDGLRGHRPQPNLA
jgi:hypothetical protein